MKKSMRAFGIGVFLAGAAIAGYDHFFPDQQTADTRALEKQIKKYEQQIDLLNNQLAKQEATDVVATTENEENKTTSASQESTSFVETVKDSSESPESGTDIIEATIYIYENVSIYTIGKQAEDLGIVKNGRELELFLAKPEYSRSIQKGAFDLHSDMTIEEIAKTLTGKKVN
ncbi:hypothetical protein [Solibacillus daqui]|uniref:hypothetical protein n=1 Tax=Solibacillus daqui TaxID=2912187 RepID=UPI0023661622|nr:hypothetical protein [Solibacillus daqui]